MARLTKATRAALPTTSFAGPGRTYPDQDTRHAVFAEQMVTRYGDEELKARVRAAVHAKYPGVGKAR